ncbi:MAG: metallophosphoesterase [Deltaproteobacteria bacterium]|nr:metallophosphoesterase [Deltaproteobacteria bacterium]
MRIAHVSDLHILDLAGVGWTRFLNKRLTGLVMLIGKRKEAHPVRLARRLVEALLELEPDHVVVTGDLTNLSLESELAAAREVLAPLGDHTRLSLIPGNHDVYTRGSERARRFERTFAPWMWPGVDGPDEHHYPWVKRLAGRDGSGDVTLLGFGSAVARLPLIATGVVSARQLERLAEVAPSLSSSFPIALVHHNLHVRGWRKDRMHGLANRDGFLAACSAAGVRLVLHGHTHVAHRFVHDGMDVIGSGSSTWWSERDDHIARFNVYRIAGGRLEGVEVRRYDRATDRFEPLAAARDEAAQAGI